MAGIERTQNASASNKFEPTGVLIEAGRQLGSQEKRHDLP